MVVGTKAQAGNFVPGKAVPSGWVSQKQNSAGALVLEKYQGNAIRSGGKLAE